MPIRRALRYVKRNKLLVAATALLMVCAGCVGAAHEAADQMTQDALKPISVPVQAYKQAVEAASSTNASERNQMEQSGLEDK